MAPQPDPLAEQKAERRKAQIDRINELSTLARTAWFSLLGYLVFVGITLLGVKDVDFFVPSRQTRLPLVGVDIPTASFFWIAPILGAALYTYLHLFLIKLWDAHVPPTTDADATHHWLVGDFVLNRQRDPVAQARPLAFLADWITRLLVWTAGSLVLGYAWWRSMPAHAEWMTLLIAACFWVTLVVGFTSWWRAEDVFGRLRPLHWSVGVPVPAAGLTALLLVAVSWLRTEGGLDNYVSGGWTLEDVTVRVPEGTPVIRWFTSDRLVLPLARTDLIGEELVVRADDWRAPAVARGTFRETFCRREGVAMDACGQPATRREETPVPVVTARSTWCYDHGLSGDACTDHFTDLDRRFADAWTEERGSERAALPELDLKGRDLRRAAASGASLVGAVLSGAQMDGAVLSWAQMDGAVLSGAQMDGAVLSGAQMDGADLTLAQMDGADLSGAHMDGADLFGAQMDGADLSGAQMDGADLFGASLRWSAWAGASNRASPAHSADLRGAQDLTQAMLDNLIGDADTLLPDGAAPDTGAPYSIPSCWEVPPAGFDRIVATAAGRFAGDDDRAALRRQFLCGPGQIAIRTGTPWPVDRPRPLDHPLGPGE